MEFDAIVHSAGVGINSVITLNPTTGNITITDADRAGVQTVFTGVNKSHAYELWFVPVQGGTYIATRPSAQPPAGMGSGR